MSSKISQTLKCDPRSVYSVRKITNPLKHIPYLSQDDYNREKEFVKALSSSVGVGEGRSRVGVVAFSHIAQHSIKLKDHNNIRSFIKALDDIPLMGESFVCSYSKKQSSRRLEK